VTNGRSPREEHTRKRKKHKEEEKRSGVVEEAYEKLKNMDVKKADPFKRGEAECVFRF
jgi:DNA polymerase II large subunit